MWIWKLVHCGKPLSEVFIQPSRCCRVREIQLTLAGHFVRWTYNTLPDIWNSCQTFHCEISGEYKIFRWTFCPARSNSFAGHFQNSPDMSGESGEFRVLCCWKLYVEHIATTNPFSQFCPIQVYVMETLPVWFATMECNHYWDFYLIMTILRFKFKHHIWHWTPTCIPFESFDRKALKMFECYSFPISSK